MLAMTGCSSSAAGNKPTYTSPYVSTTTNGSASPGVIAQPILLPVTSPVSQFPDMQSTIISLPGHTTSYTITLTGSLYSADALAEKGSAPAGDYFLVANAIVLGIPTSDVSVSVSVDGRQHTLDAPPSGFAEHLGFTLVVPVSRTVKESVQLSVNEGTVSAVVDLVTGAVVSGAAVHPAPLALPTSVESPLVPSNPVP
jgi:hypothetical protein